jgi:hypothetical protein
MSKRKAQPTPPAAPAAPKKRIRPSRAKAAQGQPKEADVEFRMYRIPMPTPEMIEKLMEEIRAGKNPASASHWQGGQVAQAPPQQPVNLGGQANTITIMTSAAIERLYTLRARFLNVPPPAMAISNEPTGNLSGPPALSTSLSATQTNLDVVLSLLAELEAAS